VGAPTHCKIKRCIVGELRMGLLVSAAATVR